MKFILLVEDSKEIYNLVKSATQGYSELTWAASLSDGRKRAQERDFDLVLLDMELPDGNGMDLCVELQAKNPLQPIFFLTAHDDLSEKVLGFSAGAEDYITKPFAPLELKARIEARLKKIDIIANNVDFLAWNEIQIDKGRQEVKILNKDIFETIDLTALEFKLLMLFAKQPSLVVSRDSILDQIWGEDVHVYSRSVDTHVSKLRKKLGPVSHIIESVHGTGYKFAPTNK